MSRIATPQHLLRDTVSLQARGSTVDSNYGVVMADSGVAVSYPADVQVVSRSDGLVAGRESGRERIRIIMAVADAASFVPSAVVLWGGNRYRVDGGQRTPHARSPLAEVFAERDF